jgi:hypothetical protein
MLAHLMYRRVVSFRFTFRNSDGVLDLFTADPAKTVAQRFLLL